MILSILKKLSWDEGFHRGATRIYGCHMNTSEDVGPTDGTALHLDFGLPKMSCCVCYSCIFTYLASQPHNNKFYYIIFCLVRDFTILRVSNSTTRNTFFLSCHPMSNDLVDQFKYSGNLVITSVVNGNHDKTQNGHVPKFL